MNREQFAALQALNKAAYAAAYACKSVSKELRTQLLDLAHTTDNLVDDNPPKPSRASRAEPGECKYCDDLRDKGEKFAPPHDASQYCTSGGRNHCSCDTCF